MRKIVALDDELALNALHISGLESIEDTIQLSLKLFVTQRLNKQTLIKTFKGRLKWFPEESKHKQISQKELRAVI